MRKIVLTLLIGSMSIAAWAQDSWWVMLTDKGVDVNCKLAAPTQFLSPAAVALRAQKGIAITEADLPVADSYVSDLSRQGYKVVSTSRWLNAVAVQTPTAPNALLALPYVKGIYPCAKLSTAAMPEATEHALPVEQLSDMDYGRGTNQAEMINIPAFHDQGFTGKGIRLAVLDGGFPGVDEMEVFAHLREADRILATYDFVDDTTFVYTASSHGTQVLSTIASYLPGEMIGTAPDVSVILCRTEDTRSERRVEEYNFMAAVEFADSVGVDIIHASLGYTEFDVEEENYTYEDLDGDQAITTKAVDWAASRGIIFTVSAGNEGGSPWRYISAPCDADSCLCVGAVNKDGKRTYFSSVGPTADGRIKPDVVAQGGNTTVVAPSGRVTTSNGTSFSGPIMAGFMACLKQANPDRTNMELIQATRLSGDQAGLPDPEYGHGIPDIVKADNMLKENEDIFEVAVAMEEKPSRTKPRPKPTPAKEVAPITFTENPQSGVANQGSKVVLTTPAGAVIRNVTVMRGLQKVSVSTKDLKIKDNSAKLKTKYLVPGKYYFKINTNQYEELIPFEVK